MSLMIRRTFPGFEDFQPSLRVFEDVMNRMINEPTGVRPWTPPVDIVENENELLLAADLPGVMMEDIDIKLEDGTLSISGSRKFESEKKEGGYHRIERAYGQFQRAFSLPDSVDAERVAASLENGVLRVTLPKKELAKPRSIKVSLGSNK